MFNINFLNYYLLKLLQKILSFTFLNKNTKTKKKIKLNKHK